MLHTGFAFIKSSIAPIVPFYADPALAAFDNWLHWGTDPWLIVHDWVRDVPMKEYLHYYLLAWLPPAIIFLPLVAASDGDRECIARFIVLYCVAWIGFGNGFAFVGSSTGPVYYDALLGGDRFAGLIKALTDSGSFDTSIGYTQKALWNSYISHNLKSGVGISAFPSVHVSVATVMALYLAERGRLLILPGLAYLGAILFLSIYTGYHYALDGYFSIAVIGGLWFALRRVKLTETSLPRLRSPATPSPAPQR